jgi:hypothetical protein
MVPMGVAGPPAAAAGKKGCVCSIGWVLFGIGFLFSPCWVAALCVPFCTKSRHDRRAAIASGIGLVVYVILIVVLAATSSRWRAQQRYAYGTPMGYGGYGHRNFFL